MASDITLHTFEDTEILTYETLNAFKDTILAKFAAGIAPSDISWPLIAEGNLDMATFNIVGGRQIWNFVNAAEYSTLADAINAAGSGGVVLIPPNTTVSDAGGQTITGNGAAIIGAGPSSVLKLSGSGAQLLKVTSGTGMMVANLTIDGNASSGTGIIGIDLQGATRALISGCWFKDFSGPALKISAGCNGVKISDCYFTGGASEHIYVEESGELLISNVSSLSSGGIALRLESLGNAPIKASLSNVRVTSAATNAIHFTGANAPGSASASEFVGSDIYVASNVAGDAVTLGSATAALQRVALSGGTIYGAATRGLVVNASTGNISGVIVDNPATTCIDLDLSQHTVVSGCTLRDGTIGIDGSGVGTGCTAANNNIFNCTTEVSLGANLDQYGNGVTVGSGDMRGFVNYTDYTAAAVALNQIMFTIPANTLHVGDVIKYKVYASITTGSGVDTLALSLQFGSTGVYMGQTDIRGSTDVVLSGTAVIKTSTTMRSVGHGYTDSGDNDVDHFDQTIDITVDNDIIAGIDTSGSGNTGIIRLVELDIIRAKV